MNVDGTVLASVMAQAVEACTAHVETGGLPFVGVVVDDAGNVVSQFGVNRVGETGDPMAHAEVVALRDVLARHDLDSLAEYTLLATGEPCGLCYRYATDHGIKRIYVAVDRDEVADFGFDYRASYPTFEITDQQRDDLFRPLTVERATEPFTRYLDLHLPGRATARPGTPSKGIPSS